MRLLFRLMVTVEGWNDLERCSVGSTLFPWSNLVDKNMSYLGVNGMVNTKKLIRSRTLHKRIYISSTRIKNSMSIRTIVSESVVDS